LDIARTVNILVKHPRSGLLPTVLYKSSRLHYIRACIGLLCLGLFVWHGGRLVRAVGIVGYQVRTLHYMHLYCMQYSYIVLY